jgi:hypothetical protein
MPLLDLGTFHQLYLNLVKEAPRTGPSEILNHMS